jgi:hypothetical protein
MPYKIIRRKHGFFVYNPETKRFFSKQPLTKEQATKQRIALALMESRRTHIPISELFH